MISEIIKNQITGTFGVFGTDLFTSIMPDKPDSCISLYDEPGTVQGYQHDYGSDWVGLHVMVRSKFDAYIKKIWQIHNVIVAYENINTTDYILVRGMVQTVPSQVDIDKDGRKLWSAHYLFLLNPKTTNRIQLNEE